MPSGLELHTMLLNSFVTLNKLFNLSLTEFADVYKTNSTYLLRLLRKVNKLPYV
jgi:hypothetical protein